ncbi:hypothetical protein POSPLADRAFT_1036480 [Postia placenta MAD-698-R-SB12]|uniref:DUF4219 domain-containing protein n=1 Tax=Postia placenta MAD-698-R-SB12 TaxID=670580 RepID=A0A1X6MP08_9APHY|nr:hypothetical protein POSPLADRAFT_1036480 [Postia placenta MAD-698-R-SB12]OSX57863.1 hypothetical protein POSPLADRAFT_1036480 [Postia placenta MAD-698-R-SB12]
MAKSLSFLIEALTGADNWRFWKVRLLYILADAELWDYVSGGHTCPAPAKADAKEEEKAVREEKIIKWKAKGRPALTAIRLRVADKVLISVKAAQTSRDAGTTLETMYEARTCSRSSKRTAQSPARRGPRRRGIHSTKDGLPG